MQRWKEKKPEETIRSIQEVLRKQNINVQEIQQSNSKGCYALTLMIKGTDLSVNGKGGTELFARASAYGEMMERLATCSLFRLKHVHKMTEKESCVFYQDEIAVGKKAYEESEYITSTSLILESDAINFFSIS